ncbi:DNA polymerase-3 subunit delta [Endobacter medicaginis]|uniref:DNA-directed DNA polymerase n=1 Tax=Endobacter medicaginis TaxID=1181271 RepID=A0A839UYA0_9PROT|nr:DNA polymerase III subunit delta [Endobacter medicaginis]MBB3172301.1 DNA polymerase-3 subunit delta [Endobacter medicaginis]MCX5474580.1 DNA polymerase III subunit delta [Endobacter medicaginis]NVN30356.1 DNA polymerase III subunit delta [Endobacter medicaginis]
MKVEPRQAARFLAELASARHPARVLLLHGDDPGLIRERAEAAVAGMLGPDRHDPFRLAVLERSGHERLEEEATAGSLIGGRRAVWVRDGNDALLGAVTRSLASGSDTLIVIEAPELPSRAKLRSALEANPAAAVLACYHEEGRALEASIATALAEAGVEIDRDALAFLADRLGSDRAAMRQEIAKLVLYAGPQRERLGLAALEALSGDAADLSLDDAAHAAMEGDLALADRAVERALAEGASPVALLRVLLAHLHRLRAARAAMAQDGLSAADAVKGLRPPVFFRRAPGVTKAVSLWPAAALDAAAARSSAVERDCKRSAMPDTALVREHFARLARESMRLSGRPSAGRR